MVNKTIYGLGIVGWHPKQIVFKLGELSRTKKRRIPYQQRRADLRIATLPCLQIQHKGGQRPLQPCQRTLEHDEAAAGQLGGRLEVHQAKRFAQLEMLFWHE